MKTFAERFNAFYENLYESQQFELIRRYHEGSNSEYPYTMDEFDEIMQNYTPHDIALHARHEGFNPNDLYFSFNGYANLVSSNNPLEWTDFDAMTEWYEWHDHIPAQIDADEWDATEDEDEEPENEE